MKKKNYSLHSLIAFACMIILIICSINLFKSVATTENLDNIVKGTHKIVNRVDSVWASQNDSNVNVSNQ